VYIITPAPRLRTVASRLLALVVVVVDLHTCVWGNTTGGPGIISTTTLAPLSNGACTPSAWGRGGSSGHRRSLGAADDWGRGGSWGSTSTRARERPWTRNGVGSGTGIQVELDSWVRSRVDTWNVVGSWVCRATAGNTELGTFHLFDCRLAMCRDEIMVTYVELSTWVGTSSVKSNKLTTEEVVSWWDAGGDSHGDLALVANEFSNGPLSVGETILIDLEPARIGDGAGGRVHFGHVCHDCHHHH